MEVVYAGQAPGELSGFSIFLAGPTPRAEKPVPSWRPQALELLRKNNFKGVVFVPEPPPGEDWPEYDIQVRWEHQMLTAADCLLFWIPRNMDTLPAMTTNVEFGMFMRSGKLVCGAPNDAEHMRYIREVCGIYGIVCARELQETVLSALAMLQANVPHSKTGRIIASPVAWKGEHVRVELTRYRNREGKIRTYETIRRNTHGEIVSIMALTTDGGVEKAVLIKSYRVPHDDYVVEFPAGLADRKGESSEALAARELLEETGYQPGPVMERILAGPFDAGMNDDILAIYFTRGARKVAEPRLEESEDIQVILVPLAELDEFVEHPPEGCRPDVKLLNILPLLRKRGRI